MSARVAVGLLAGLVLVGCGRRSVCEEELDIRLDCGLLVESVVEDLDRKQLACEEESERGCASTCALEAFESDGCEGLSDPTRGNYLVCLVNCIPDTTTSSTP